MYYYDIPLKKDKVQVLSTELTVSFPLYFGCEIEAQFTKYLNGLNYDRIFLFCDENIYKLYGESFFKQLLTLDKPVELLIIPQGEHSKTFPKLEEMCETLIEKRVSKISLLISFGGGVVGTLVGMIAGLIYRGIRFIEIPTTLSGQTDSILSNKQAVNGRTGKNHFGFYYAPLFCWVDTRYLVSEPSRSMRSGLIEAVKNGFINDLEFLDYLDTKLKKDIPYSAEEIYNLAYNIIRSKVNILRKDPSEKKLAIILEYGHTFGHGIEWLAATHHIENIQHGEAVAIGMKIAAEVSYKLGYLTREEKDLHYHMIDDKVGVSIKLPEFITSTVLLDAMVADNKKQGHDLQFILLEKVGKCLNPHGDYLNTVDLKLIGEVIDEFKKTQGN